jgi:hypothetical protein
MIQLMSAPVASMHLRVASAISGPIPSPVTNVTSVISITPGIHKSQIISSGCGPVNDNVSDLLLIGGAV